MLDAAIGPRFEASSLRIRRVFSAAGTLDVALGSLPASSLASVLDTTALDSTVPSVISRGASGHVRDPVLNLAPTTGPLMAIKTQPVSGMPDIARRAPLPACWAWVVLPAPLGSDRVRRRWS